MTRESDNAMARSICSICYEDIKLIYEDLQAISICGHVFHELCLQQWFEYCPAGKKTTCPICKQACARKNATRLYFQSSAESTQPACHQKSSDSSTNSEELREQIRKLEEKIAALNGVIEILQQQVGQMNVELSISKGRAKNEEAMREEALLEKERIRKLLHSKNEELDGMSEERSQLQQRCLALAKELATLKLVSDVNLNEEQVSKLATLGAGANKDVVADILQKSLVLRNQKYKELMAQCNQLGRGEILSQRKLEKAEEKLKKLKARLHELEKGFEEKDNEMLRALNNSSKPAEAAGQSGFHPVGKSVGLPQDSGETTLFCINSLQQNAAPSVAQEKHAQEVCVAKDMDENYVIVLDEESPSFDLNTNSIPFASCSVSSCSENAIQLKMAQEVCAVQHTGPQRLYSPAVNIITDMDAAEDLMVLSGPNPAAKKLHPDCALRGAPPIKREIPLHEPISVPGLTDPDGEYRNLGRWCRRAQTKGSSSVPDSALISVGPDGRGGRVKVLRTHNPPSDGTNNASIWPKRCKFGAKPSGNSPGCIQIEHYFVKKEAS